MRFLLLFSILYSSVLAQNLTINEIMSKNNGTILDSDNETSDWIELYNSSNQTINLLNFGMSDEEGNLFKWGFPDINIPPNSTYLIFASGKNSITNTEIHTNFKIAALGEELYLTNPQGELIDILPAKILLEDESYGRLPDGSDNILLLDLPSPGSSNNASNQITFSEIAGFYTEEFKLRLGSVLGDSIYYTLDGSLPTQNSSLYLDSLFIQNRNSEPNYFCEFPSSPDQSLISNKAWESPNSLVDKATIIRCRTYKNGIPSSKIYTASYFVDEDMFSKYEFPVISLVTEQSNFFAEDSGIYVPGIHFDENSPEWTGNYCNTGREWERPIHIEYFEQSGILAFAQDAGVRIHGGKTRIAAQKTLRLYARKEYSKSHFNYKLLPQIENQKFKRFLLRTSMGDWTGHTIIKDVLAQDISRELNIETQGFQPSIVFLNGEYWGIHTIRERIDEYYISDKFDIDKDSIDLINSVSQETISGSRDGYIDLLEFIEENDLTENTNYNYVATQIDIGNYIDYQIAEMFFANYDWPANNVKLWKPQSEGGKWRWIFYDLDNSFKQYEYNMFVHCTNTDESIGWPNSPKSTFLFRNLMLNNQFENQFIKRYVELLDKQFSLSRLLSKKNQIEALYSTGMAAHSARWNYPDMGSSWTNSIDEIILPFITKRACFVEQHLKEFFPVHEIEYTCGGLTDRNHLKLYPNSNNGHFFVYNDSNETIKGDLLISSINGITVYIEESIYLNAYENKELNLANFPTGVYLLRYKSSVHTESLKFVIIN